MTTLRVALDASQMLAVSRQVTAGLQQMGEAAKQTAKAVDVVQTETVATARSMDVTRESLKATSGAIQTAGNVRQLVDSLKEVDGSFGSIANVAANAAQTLLSFGRAAEDFSQLKDASQAVTNAMGAQAAATAATGAATGTAATATTVWTRATLALRAAWAAHPVLLIGTVLAAAATAMAAFSSSTKKATEDSAALAEQQKALEQSLKNVLRIQAEGRLGTQFGIAGAAEEARRREQQAVFQQAVDVETMRMRGGPGVRVADIAGGRQVEDILNAQQTVRFQREVEQALTIARMRQQTGIGSRERGNVIELKPPGQMTAEERASYDALRKQVAEEVAAGFTVGYDEAINNLQGRFGELGNTMQQAFMPDMQRERVVAEFRQQITPTPLLSEREQNLQRQEEIDIELRRIELMRQIQTGLVEESRLAGLTTDQREQELAILRIKQEALQAGVALTDEELANIEGMLDAQRRLTAARRASEYDRSTQADYAERFRLEGMTEDQRRIEQAVAARRAEAAQANIPFTPEREQFARENEVALTQLAELRATGQEVGAALGNSFVNAATGVATLRQALAALLQDLIRIAAQRAIIAPLADALGGAFSSLGPTAGQRAADMGSMGNEYSSSNYA